MLPLNPTERKIAWLTDMMWWTKRQEQTAEVVEWRSWAVTRITELASNGEPSTFIPNKTKTRIKVTIDDLL